MSSPPVKYQRFFDFTTFAANNPDKPLPGNSVDVEFNRLKQTTDQTIDRLALIQRDDGKLQDGAITTNSLADGSVTEPKLATGAVSTRALGFAVVDNTKLAPNAVTESTILNQNVTTQKLADKSVTSAKLADNITLPPAANIQINSLGVGMAAPITAGGLAVAGLADLFSNLHVHNNAQIDGALGVNSIVHFLSTLQVDGITTLGAKLNVTAGGVDVTGASIFRSAVQFLAGASVAGLTVTGALALPDNSITSAMLADLNVGTADLMDGSVTNPKLALNAVASGNVLPLAIGTTHLQDLCVTTAKLADQAVDSTKIKDGAIMPADLNAATIALISTAGTPRGQWLTATNYAVRDAVTNLGGVYSAVTAHLSGVFAADLAAGKWLQTGQIFDQNVNTTDSVQFAKVWLGGKTAAFPMLVNSGAELHAKLGDNSSFATVRAQNFVAQGSQFYAGGGTSIFSPSDGVWRLLNGAGNDFNMLQFGGSTAVFPALRRIGSELQSVFADISDYAPFTASSFGLSRIGALVAPGNGLFLATLAGGIGFAAGNGERLRLDNIGNLGLAVTPAAWGPNYKVLQIGTSALGGWVGAGAPATYLSTNYYQDGANSKYLVAGAAALMVADATAGAFSWYTAPAGAAGANIAFSQRMNLSQLGVLGVPGGINVGNSNISGNLNVSKLDQGNYSRRYHIYLSGMVHGSNYDVIRIPPGPGITKCILRTHCFVANLQPNYSYHVREDVWISCDSGGVPGGRAMGNVYSMQYSINSGIINCSFSYDFLRSSNLDYIRLWPTCTGANSAGGQLGAMIEVILSGDSALTAS